MAGLPAPVERAREGNPVRRGLAPRVPIADHFPEVDRRPPHPGACIRVRVPHVEGERRERRETIFSLSIRNISSNGLDGTPDL